MKIWIVAVRLTASCLLLLMGVPAQARAAAGAPTQARTAAGNPTHTETAVLAGGCFWGLEAVFERLRGVSKVVSGFAGGNGVTAHYELVSTGATGHAESVAITYDPTQISYATLLKVYFAVAHDPTQLDRQGPDSGSQYRSEIFFTDAAQQHVAQATIAALTAAHTYKDPIVTKLEALHAFYPAEEYHQHFYDRNPDYPYIVYNDKPKVAELHARFPELIAPGK